MSASAFAALTMSARLEPRPRRMDLHDVTCSQLDPPPAQATRAGGAQFRVQIRVRAGQPSQCCVLEGQRTVAADDTNTLVDQLEDLEEVLEPLELFS